MTIPGIQDPAIPLGSFIVVSGVSGFIGSHVADQLLAAGYKVRGTTRSVQKSVWLEVYFKNKYSSDSFELIQVPDMAAESAFDEAVIGNFTIFRTMIRAWDTNSLHRRCRRLCPCCERHDPLY